MEYLSTTSALRQDEAEQRMARPLGVRGHRKAAHTIGSVTMGRELRVESQLEVLAALALDIDPRVCVIRPQPFTVRLDLMTLFPTRQEAVAAAPKVSRRTDRASQDEVHVYTPDFQVGWHLPTDLVLECKPKAKLEKQVSEVAQWRQALFNLGFRFACITDDMLQAPGLHFNLVCLRDALKGLKQPGALERLTALEAIVTTLKGPTALRTLQVQLPDDVIQMGIACGMLGCDLRKGILGPGTEVRPAHGDLAHLQLLDLES